MVSKIKLGDIAVDVVLKDIKNVHLSVYPPTGRVRISAPKRMNIDTIRVFAISKLDWIKRQQRKLRDQERESPREYLDRESHYLWGKRYLLQVSEEDSSPSIEIKHHKMILRVRPGTSCDTKEAIVARWYREQIKAVVPDMVSKWEKIIGVNVDRIYVRKMKTKWGSCNPEKRNIRLNTDLAKKPKQCLEYILVHELTHLRERAHNDRFAALMTRYMPQWREYRAMLNATPLANSDWKY